MATIFIRRDTVSNGARALAGSLRSRGHRAILTDRQQYNSSFVINWGSLVAINGARVLVNPREAVAIARDKLATFRHLAEKDFQFLPKFWEDREQAERERGSAIVLERHSLTGQSGSGIVVKREGEALGNAPLYVKYVRKNKEYRVHVFNGQAIAVQEKRRESEAEQTPDQALIRNRDNGWVFCVNDVSDRNDIREVSVAACGGIGLGFGAVDLVVDRSTDKPLVLEINSKPGLESPTVLSAYADAIEGML